MASEPEPVGVPEIAERLGVKPATVHQWLFRELLPEARWTVSGLRAWDWSQVLYWAGVTGRLSEGSVPWREFIDRFGRDPAERRGGGALDPDVAAKAVAKPPRKRRAPAAKPRKRPPKAKAS